MTDRHRRIVQAVLTALVLFDLNLVITVAVFPDTWWALFHTTDEPAGGSLLFLRRCGANWLAFLLLQGLAWWRWRREAGWLAVVAGVRLSDIFTDPIYAVAAADASWFAWAGLPLMGVCNLLLGWFFWRAYLAARHAPPT